MPEGDKRRREHEVYAELAELAGSFIHEIKNHLSTLGLNLQLLLEDFQDPQSQRERRALERIRVDRDALLSLVGGLDAKSVIAFAPGAHGAGHQLTARVFVDYYGVPEDAATGSGNGCLASWLVQHRYFDEDPIDIRVEQGVSIGRPSSLHLRAMRTSHGIEVRVGGGVVDVARGMLLAARLA